MPEFTVPQLLALAKDALSNRPKTYKKGGTVEHKGVNITHLELSPQAVDGGAVFHPEHFADGGGTESVDPNALVAVHNLSPEKLEYSDKLGGLPVPSIAIANPNHGFEGYGSISLIAHPDLVTPSKNNPVFGADVYSPRFPSLNDEKTKIFKGFTPSGNRRYIPLTLENAVKEMKGNIRGGESYNYGAGSVRSSVAPKFKNLKDIQRNRNKIVKKEQFRHEAEKANDELWNIASDFHPHSKYSGNLLQHVDDFQEMLKEVGIGKGIRSITDHYNDLPPEKLQKALDYLNKLKMMETEYFEAKPQRAVGIHEFKGAIVPHKDMEQVRPILEKHGIQQIEGYDHEDDDSKKNALMKFKHLFFNRGGEVEDYAKGGSVPHIPHPATRIPGVHIITADAGEPIFHGEL